MQLRPRRFTHQGGDARINHGFLAQEVEALVQNDALVKPPDAPTDAYGMQPLQLISILTRAIQELEARLRALEGVAR